MTQLPSEDDTPFSLPHDVPEEMPIDHPELDSQIDLQEAYDEGMDDMADSDPYRMDDDPIKSAKRLMRAGVGSEERYTTNHDIMRHWARLRYGHPAHVVGIEDSLDEGGLYIYFEDDEPEIDVEPISWPEFFKIFEKYKLAFLYRTKTRSGSQSRFYKFIARHDIDRLTQAHPVG